MSEIVFNVHQEADGGYHTRAQDLALHTQGDTWTELCANVVEVVELYYSTIGQPRPKIIRLHLVHDEALLVA